MNPLGLILAAAGVFSICGGALDWDWFMNSRRARFFVAILGRMGARVVYVVLGLVITVIGTLIAAGVIKGGA